MNNKPVAYMQTWQNQDGELKKTVNIEQIGKQDIPLYTHPVKDQSNLVSVVKDHIEDLVRCVKLLRNYDMYSTADEMEVAIKELGDAIESHPVKELTDEEIISCAEINFVREELTNKTPEYMWIMDFARAILRKAQEK